MYVKSKVRLSFHFNEKCLANFLLQGKKEKKIYYISFHVPYFLDVMTYSTVWGYIMSPFSFRLILKKFCLTYVMQMFHIDEQNL